MNKELVSKIGNSVIYLSNHCEELHNKTFFLKMIYLLDEVSIQETGLPFFNLNYELWERGPVNRQLFQLKSIKSNFFKDYFITENNKVKTVAEFNDDEFSDNDITILEKVCNRFKYCNTKELVNHTHKPGSPWHLAASQNNLLDQKGELIVTSTQIPLDLSTLISNNESKLFNYNLFKESF